MDKFGIFNLLNSFLNANSAQEKNTDQENDTKNDTFGSILSAIKNNLNTNNSSPSQPKTNPAPSQSQPIKPLQRSMLSTMTSHDQFIKRVKEKNKG